MRLAVWVLWAAEEWGPLGKPSCWEHHCPAGASALPGPGGPVTVAAAWVPLPTPPPPKHVLPLFSAPPFPTFGFPLTLTTPEKGQVQG